MAVWAVIAAIVSAVAAVAAVFYAWRMDRTAKGSLEASCIAAEAAKTSAAASVRSASAAERSVSLEVARRHAELTPRFRADLTPEGPGVRSPLLTLFLLGPPDLERIDELKVTIFDTKRPAAGWKEPGKPEATPEQMDAVLWGPYRFSGGNGKHDEASKDGMPVGQDRRFSLAPTSAPSWAPAEPEAWRFRVGTSLGLQIEARREGWEPWTVTGRVDASAERPTAEIP